MHEITQFVGRGIIVLVVACRVNRKQMMIVCSVEEHEELEYKFNFKIN